MSFALLVGCGEVRGTPAPARVDVKALDVGAYPLDRVVYDRAAGADGGLVESMRMSAAIAPAVQIDPMLTGGRTSAVVANAHDAVSVGGLSQATGPVLERNRLLAGYVEVGADYPRPKTGQPENPNATVVGTAALRFPDAATAERAAADLETADFDVAASLNRRLQLADYSAAHIHWRPGVPTIGAFLAHGDFVLSVFVRRPQADENDLLAWVRKVFDTQTATLDRFRPTAERDLPILLVDSEDLLARVMTRDRSQRAPNAETFGVFGPAVIAGGSLDATFWWQSFQTAGVDAVAFLDHDTLVRARDAKSARALLNTLATQRQTFYVDADAPAKVPDVHCLAPKAGVDPNDVWSYKCYLVFGRYLAVVNDADRTNALQRTAAQYALLANGF